MIALLGMSHVRGTYVTTRGEVRAHSCDYRGSSEESPV
jgi:hypothetical protein